MQIEKSNNFQTRQDIRKPSNGQPKPNRDIDRHFQSSTPLTTEIIIPPFSGTRKVLNRRSGTRLSVAETRIENHSRLVTSLPVSDTLLAVEINIPATIDQQKSDGRIRQTVSLDCRKQSHITCEHTGNML